ncbi:MAG: hypothetical protein LBT00_00695 [Spirochaetaceae bacterium]|jgi:hypothetical protein|nr:hypothetical protein [Spirochaetaceae bacterium]
MSERRHLRSIAKNGRITGIFTNGLLANNHTNQHEQPVIASPPPVIANVAKQSSVRAFSVWIASPFGFAMTALPQPHEPTRATCHCESASRYCERTTRHCERSEAIQCEGLLRLDCFTLRVRNDGSATTTRANTSNLSLRVRLPLLRAGYPSLRA